MTREERATKFVSRVLHHRHRDLADSIVRATLPAIEAQPLPVFYKELGTAAFGAMKARIRARCADVAPMG